MKITLKKLLNKREVDAALVDFLGTIVYTLIFIAAVIAAVDTLGIPATSFMAILGAAGLASRSGIKRFLIQFRLGCHAGTVPAVYQG